MVLDHYINGKVERISPEAPVPILLMERQKYELGGVGNVARNIANMGAKTSLIFLQGNDQASNIVKKLLHNEKNIKNACINIPNFKTPIKTRLIKNDEHLLRVDDEDINFKLLNKYKILILNKLKKEIKKNDLIILSDYNKGLLDKDLIKKIISIAIRFNKIIIADPKKIDLSSYEGVNILTPNQKEMADASKNNLLSEKDLLLFAKDIIKKFGIKNLLVTRSEKGMLLINNKFIKEIKANAKNVIDVTGAGDTVIAIVGLMLILGLSVEDSVEVSNYAAGLVVGRSGTASVSFIDLIK